MMLRRSGRSGAMFLGVGLMWVANLACSTTRDEEAGEVRWKCFERANDCYCFELRPGSDARSIDPEVLVCRAFNCCLHAPGDGAPDCTCEDLTTDCQAEASSRPGTTVVPQCPLEVDLSRCAASGINCRDDFLQERGLLGCCPGLACLANTEGVPVCQ